MLLTPHTLVGVALGYTIQNPVIAAPLSFGMHFAADLVPHWDFFTDVPEEEAFTSYRPMAIAADVGLGVAIGSFFTLYALWVLNDPNLALTVFLSGIAGVLPDILSILIVHIKKLGKIFGWISKLNYNLQTDAGPVLGIFTQLVAVVFSLLLIVRSIGL